MDIQILLNPWYFAVFQWFTTGKKNTIVQQLRSGAVPDRFACALLAEILSGEWKRPKKFGDSGLQPDDSLHLLTKAIYQEERERIKATKPTQGGKTAWSEEALVATAKRLKTQGHTKRDLTPDSVKKILLNPEKQYRRKSDNQYKAFEEALQKIREKLPD